MYRFNFHRPEHLDEALSLYRGTEAPKILAGGQTFIPTMKQRLAQPSDVISLGKIEGLNYIKVEREGLLIGSMTTHAAVADSEMVQSIIPSLSKLAAKIGDRQVRHRGTLGGSVCNNDPAADYPSALVALRAEIRTDRRKITADDFFISMFETALESDEIVESIYFPKPIKASYAKFPNPASRYALVGVFVAKHEDEVRVAVTGAGPSVFRVDKMEQALMSSFDANAIEDIKVLPDDLSEDIHATQEYRAHLVTIMARRAIQACG